MGWSGHRAGWLAGLSRPARGIMLYGTLWIRIVFLRFLPISCIVDCLRIRVLSYDCLRSHVRQHVVFSTSKVYVRKCGCSFEMFRAHTYEIGCLRRRVRQHACSQNVHGIFERAFSVFVHSSYTHTHVFALCVCLRRRARQHFSGCRTTRVFVRR